MAEQYLNKPGVSHLWSSMKSYLSVEIVKALAGAGLTIKILDELPETGENMVLYFIRHGGGGSYTEESTFAEVYGVDIPEKGEWVNFKFPDDDTYAEAEVKILPTHTISDVINTLNASPSVTIYGVKASFDSGKQEIVFKNRDQEELELIIEINESPIVKPSNPNVYDEYMWVDGKFELIGSTQVDLSDYWSKSDLVALTDDEIDEIIQDMASY